MKIKVTNLVLLIAMMFGFQVFAQNRANVEKLNELSKQFETKWNEAQQRVVKYAVENNLKIWHETEDGRVMEMVDVREGQPVYYITDNRGADKTTRVDQLWPGGSLNLDYSGEGYSQLGEWDAGHVRKTHQEFMDGSTSRATPQDGNYATHFHATHVAGTMIAAGVNPEAKGALYGGNLKYWQWSADDSEMATAGANGLEISNHSYGFLAGWNYDNGTLKWWGNSAISTDEDYKFGFYNNDARGWDQIAYNAPNYLIVKSAGNDRGEGPSDAGNGKADVDGGEDGYDCIGTRGVAKNILTVGAVYEVDVYEGPQSVVMSDFSCWGPADDGRIKPDIVGKGVDVFSTLDGSNTDYGASQGTSMSAPNVSGSMAMLQYHYQQT
ncbi:MAG: peptidase S8, partial [Marinilabiliales bacterium]